MRRIWAYLLVLLIIFSLAVHAFAATGATGIKTTATVSSDGSCQVSMSVTLRLEAAIGDLSFPVPSQARGVTVNGSRVPTSRSNGVVEADLSRLYGGSIGEFPVVIAYSLPSIVEYDELGRLMLTLPLLSGFDYPISTMDFTISLPGEIDGKPTFSSGYHQSSIEADITYDIEGYNIIGQVTKPLKDHETLSMSLEVSPEVFPQDIIETLSLEIDDIAMYVFAALALIYWLVLLRCLPPRWWLRRSTAPEGMTAGEAGSAITAQGADLTMMVLSWAQMGYILIHLDDNGRVMLHKRMEMGNERSGFEVRVFQNLFGKRQMVDGTGYAYANLCRKVATMTPNVRTWFRPASGNVLIFRVLAALVGLFGGMSAGVALMGDSVLAGLGIVLMSILGLAVAYIIQSGMYCLFLRDKMPLWISLGFSAVWLILGAVTGEFLIALGVVAVQLLSGLMAAYGGRRNDLGRLTMAQVLSLRRYLKKLSPADVQRLCMTDPEYFFNMAPYALALGVDQQFAKRFGSMRLPACPYLTTGMDGHMTALEWAKLMEKAVTSLDHKQKRLPYEQLLSAGASARQEPQRRPGSKRRRR